MTEVFTAVELDGDGAHPAAWRFSGRAPAEVFSPTALRSTVSAAERAGFVFATFADSPTPPSPDRDVAGRIEAGIRASFAATFTDRIGLAPQLHVTTTEPFHLATQLAALDHATHGRAAWVVGAADDADARSTVGADPLDDAALSREVLDVVDAARLLWDSWEDDAIVRDVSTGRFVDADKVHHIDFEGSTFSVKGPLITPRPPQGQIVVIADAALGLGDRADITLVGQDRKADSPLVVADIDVVLDTPAATASERLARLDDETPWAESGRFRHVGGTAELVDLILSLGLTVDGVRFRPAVLSQDLPVLVDDVLPALASAGALRSPAAGSTLRANLGLARPANVFASQ